MTDTPKPLTPEELANYRDLAQVDPPQGDDGESRAWQNWTADVRMFLSHIAALEKELKPHRLERVAEFNESPQESLASLNRAYAALQAENERLRRHAEELQVALDEATGGSKE